MDEGASAGNAGEPWRKRRRGNPARPRRVPSSSHIRRRACDNRWPVVQVWPGRRIGGDRVGDAITLRERQTDALRGVRRLVVVQGGVMPADPLPARGRAARCPRGWPVSGEGADRDQAQKRAPTSPRTRGPAPDRRAERGCWRPPGATVRGEGLKEEGGLARWVSCWKPSPIQPTSHEPGHVSGPMRERQGSTASRCTPSTPMPSTSSHRCVVGCSRPSATSLRRCGGWTSPSPTGEPARSGSPPSPIGWSNRPPGR